jgi:hypothetical protein
LFVFQHFIDIATDLRANPMMKDLEIAFTAKEVTAFGGVSLLYKMLDNCHFKEALSAVDLPLQGSNRGKSPEQLIYGLFTGVWCGASCYNHLDIVRFDPTLLCCKPNNWSVF